MTAGGASSQNGQSLPRRRVGGSATGCAAGAEWAGVEARGVRRGVAVTTGAGDSWRGVGDGAGNGDSRGGTYGARCRGAFGERTAAESGDTISDDSSTASKALAGTAFSWSSSPVGQLLSALPWKNQSEPLSASSRPYVFIAASTVRVSARSPAVLYDAFSRKRAPIGGRFASFAAPAWWRAGQTYERSVRATVKRIAWST